MKLLLLSNSTMKGEPYLSWPQDHLNTFLKGIDELLFIPYAGITMSYDIYTKNVSESFKSAGTKVIGIHNIECKSEAIEKAQAIAVGGGNTFHLLHMMQREKLIEPITRVVKSGTPYIGWSAGSNVACPTIMTTNDMPIIQPESFQALGLTNFQINAHYTEKTIEGHGGESRDLRIKELLEINPELKVIGLPEGKLLQLEENQWFLKGINSEPTYLFSAGVKPQIIKEGEVRKLQE